MKEPDLRVPSMSRYVVVRGALGVGKTTVARAIAASLNGRRISLDEILDREQLEEWESGFVSERSFLRANGFAVAEAAPLLAGGVPVVFDGNFYHRPAIEDLLARLEFPHLVVTLWAPLTVCLERDRGRSPSYGEESVRMVYAKTAGVEFGLRLDARAPVPALVQEIASFLDEAVRNGRRPVQGAGAVPKKPNEGA